MSIVLSKTRRKVSILNPLKEFRVDEWEIEYRCDPLTGRNTTIIPKLKDYWLKFLKSDLEMLRRYVVQTRKICPFCPENVFSRTPKFLPEEFDDGRLKYGEATAFPNFIGYAGKSAVIVLSKDHYLPPSKLNVEILYNGITLGIDVMKKWRELYDHIRYGVLLLNYTPSAGSVIIHPHMQVLSRDRPVTLQRLLLECSLEYSWRHGSNYWMDLIALEKDLGERYLSGKNGVHWITPFAPLRGILEVQGILDTSSNIFSLADETILSIADGISRILMYYEHLGVTSFNIAIIPGPLRSDVSYYNTNIFVIARSGLNQMGLTDSWALPYLLWDGEAIEEPEKLAEELKPYFV